MYNKLFTVKMTLTEIDFKNLSEILICSKKRYFIISTLIKSLAITIILSIFKNITDIKYIVYLWMIILIPISIGMAILRRHRVNKAIIRTFNKSNSQSLIVCIDVYNDRFCLSKLNEDNMDVFKFDKLLKIIESQDYFIVYKESNKPNLISKEFMTEQMINTFREKCKSYSKSNNKEIKLISNSIIKKFMYPKSIVPVCGIIIIFLSLLVIFTPMQKDKKSTDNPNIFTGKIYPTGTLTLLDSKNFKFDENMLSCPIRHMTVASAPILDDSDENYIRNLYSNTSLYIIPKESFDKIIYTEDKKLYSKVRYQTIFSCEYDFDKTYLADGYIYQNGDFYQAIYDYSQGECNPIYVKGKFTNDEMNQLQQIYNKAFNSKLNKKVT